MSKSAVDMVLGHDSDANVVFALSRDVKSVYIVVCDPQEMNSVLLKRTKVGSYTTSAGDIAHKLGATKTIFFDQ